MKHCVKCGCEIIDGVNGCMMMDDCFECHGPRYYPKPIVVDPFASCDALDALEGRCLDDDYALR